MVKIKGGKGVVNSFFEEDVTHIFELPGVYTLEIYDALYDRLDDVELVTVKHESNASIMADVYGRLTGEPGICLVTTGPGATNSLTGVGEAYGAASPMVHISSSVSRDGPSMEVHGLYDKKFTEKTFKPVTKWSTTVQEVSEVHDTLSKAFEIARTPKKGPVHIDFPRDVLSESAEVNPYITRKIKLNIPDEKLLNDIASVLADSVRPVICLGDHIDLTLRKEIIDIAHILNAPTIVSSISVGQFPQDDDLYAGYITDFKEAIHPTSQHILESADVVLVLGVGYDTEKFHIIRDYNKNEVIFLDSENTGNEEYNGLWGTGDLQSTLLHLYKILKNKQIKNPQSKHDWKQVNIEVNKQIDEEIKSYEAHTPIHQSVAADKLKNYIDRETIIAEDDTVSGWMFMKYLGLREPCTMIEMGVYGNIGFSVPAGVAAKVTFPERKVISVIGDGGFLFSCMEIATAVQSSANLVVLVINDAKYNAIWKSQEVGYNCRYVSSELPVCDFAKLGEGLGAKGININNPADLESAYEEALNANRPTVIDIEADYRS